MWACARLSVFSGASSTVSSVDPGLANPRKSARPRRALRGGANLHGSRWNPPGLAVVDTAAAPPLAALELFANLKPDNVPPNLASIAASVPDDVTVEAASAGELPESWRGYSAPESLQELAARWVVGARMAVLAVPSAVIPHERN